jgi:transcriptional regulator with XRE-family HTH domain
LIKAAFAVQSNAGRENLLGRPMSGYELRAKRNAADISGVLVCRKSGISRSRLCDIERGNVSPTADEISRIAEALDSLIAAREKIKHLAAEVGWPLTEVAL